MASKKAAKSERRTITWGLVVAFVMLVAAFLFLRSEYFTVSNYVITDINTVTRDDIVARCSQLEHNLFAFDVDKAKMLIEASPWVQSASISRRLPDTIVISIVERVPVAFVPMENGTYLVDMEGRILAEDDGKRHGLVALTGVVGQASPGQFLDDTTYGWAFRVLAALGQISRTKLAEIHIQDGECTLILDDECAVLLGKEAPGVSQKTLLLESILQDLSQDGSYAEHIDLRFDKPVVRFPQEVGG